MSSLTSITRNLNSSLVFVPKERYLFYKILLVQIKAGLSVSDALSELSDNLNVSVNITKVSKKCIEVMDDEGGTFASGLEESLMVPVFEYSLIAVAEKTGDLDNILESFDKDSVEDISLSSKVIFPLWYYISALSLLIFAISKSYLIKDKMGDEFDLSNNFAINIGIFIHDNQYYLGLSFVFLIFFIAFIRSNLEGPIRKFILFFDMESRLLFSYRYTKFATLMYRVGATHEQILLSALEVFAGNGYLVKQLNAAYQACIVENIEYEIALSETIFDEKFSSLLKAFVPSGQRSAYFKAFESISEIQKTLLIDLYTKIKGFLTVIVVVAIIFLILTIFTSSYSIVSSSL